jgi:transposase-like protein
MPARKKRVANLKVVDAETKKPEIEVLEKPVRRKFTRAYKAKILKEIDAAPAGTIGAILRREGLYSSHLAKWRAERDERGLSAKKRGPKINPLSGEVKRLRQENKRLEKRLLQANEIIDLQKKISKILGITLNESGERG